MKSFPSPSYLANSMESPGLADRDTTGRWVLREERGAKAFAMGRKLRNVAALMMFGGWVSALLFVDLRWCARGMDVGCGLWL